MDIDPRHRGYECWASGGSTFANILFNCKGEVIANAKPSSTNFGIWWDGDLLREILDSNRISKWNWINSMDITIFTAVNCSSNNGTKSTPTLCADILADWREEVIYRTDDNQQLRIFTTTIPTDYRFYTFMHDPVYRLSVAWQNVAYNQPTQTGFYMGHGMQAPPRPRIRVAAQRLYGDFTGDDIVNVDDLPEFFKIWLNNDCSENAELDLNGDCVMNLCEFSLLALNWLVDNSGQRR